MNGQADEPSETEPMLDAVSADEVDAVSTNEIDDGAVRDELPEDLNATEYVGPYVFPNNNRRRIAATLYVVIGLVFVVLWLVANDSPMVNAGFGWGGAVLAAVGIYGLIAGWNLAVDENDALVAATRSVGFPIGHASAQLGWRGWLSRPTWRILLYSNEPQPERRGLVLVDGNDGEVLDTIVENNPEDWSSYV